MKSMEIYIVGLDGTKSGMLHVESNVKQQPKSYSTGGILFPSPKHVKLEEITMCCLVSTRQDFTKVNRCIIPS